MTPEFQQLGFTKHIYANGRRSIADEFIKLDSCGIYILHFSNGEYYVGQAVNVASRFMQHRVNHIDIEYISFKCVEKTKLNEVEREVIKYMEEQQKPLRNISLVSIIRGETELDEIINPEEQDKWLNEDFSWETLETERFEYPEQRKKYTNKFLKLKKNEQFEFVCQILQEYILFTIPYPKRTEYSFWSLTCLPNPGALARINIFWQETFCIYEDELEVTEKGRKIIAKGFRILIYVAKSVLFARRSKTYFENKFKSIYFSDSILPSGGTDQQLFYCEEYEVFDILYHEDIFPAVKIFNLRLMRKGPCSSSRFHSFDLADEILRTDNIKR